MGPIKSIEAAIRSKFHVVAGPALHDRVLARVRQANERSNETTPAPEPVTRRAIMRSPLVKLGVAAAIIAVVGVGIMEFIGTGSQSGVVWAQVAKNVEASRGVIFRTRDTGSRNPNDDWPNAYRITWRSATLNRGDRCRNGQIYRTLYTNLDTKTMLGVDHDHKTYHTQALSEEMLRQVREEGWGWSDPQALVNKVLSLGHRALGQKTIDGVLCEGIEATTPDAGTAQLWVAVETGYPVLMEVESVDKEGIRHTSTLDQFRWNVDLPAEGVEPEIPAGYDPLHGQMQIIHGGPSGAKRSDIASAVAKKNVPVDFRPLVELGLVSDEQTPPPPAVTLKDVQETYAARDKVMSGWPKYADLRDSLRQELDQKLNLPSCPVDRLVQFGDLLREKYWDVGGDFSATSYRYGYMARVLLEIAHAREPNNLAVGDELAEAIMTAQTVLSGKDFRDALRELRDAQFRQVRAEMEKGRPPVWEDFARVGDLFILSGEPAERLAVIDWLTAHAQAGGWTGYADLLAQMRANADRGRLFYNIYIAAGSKYPEEFRYSGRLPSFKGPRSRAVVPAHPLTPAGAPQQSQ
jgi:hypothetical protein